MRQPQPQEWDAKTLSQGYVADYKPFNFVDGEGVRSSLYLSGCLFACEDCFNKAAQNFKYGQPYTAELEEQIMADLQPNYVQGLTLLGGEPFLNTGVCLPLVKRVRKEFGKTKDIWSWSGYTFEQLQRETVDKQELLGYLDVLVDGPFIKEEKNLQLQFRGSNNQRIVDVPKSLATGEVVLWGKRKDADKKYEQIHKADLI